MKKPARFIVIDDDLTNNLLCRIAIKGIAGDTEIQTFDIPEKGFEYILSQYSKTKTEIPTALFLDINMPTWNGWDFLKNFETLDTGIQKQIKIYMLSSSVNPNDRARARESRITVDYIEKPLSSKIVSEIFYPEKSDFGNVTGLINDTTGIQTSADLVELKSVASRFVTKSFKKKTLLYSEGDTATGLFYIKEGKVKTFKTNPDGKDFITGLHGPEDFLGYVSLLENRYYTETATALEETTISIIPKEVFQKLVFENAEVGRKFIHLLSQNLVEKEEQLLSLAYDSVRQRVAGALLELQKKYLEEAGKKFSISFTREDLANIVGTATESLIRTLSDLKDEGAIEIDGSTISIIDKSRLEKIIL